MMFSEWLRHAMKHEGWSQVEMAGRSTLSLEMIKAMCLGRRLPSFASAVKVRDALCCTLDEMSYCDEFATDRRSENYHQQPKGKTNGKQRAGKRKGKATKATAGRKRQGKRKAKKATGITVQEPSGPGGNQAARD